MLDLRDGSGMKGKCGRRFQKEHGDKTTRSGSNWKIAHKWVRAGCTSRHRTYRKKGRKWGAGEAWRGICPAEQEPKAIWSVRALQPEMMHR